MSNKNIMGQSGAKVKLKYLFASDLLRQNAVCCNEKCHILYLVISQASLIFQILQRQHNYPVIPSEESKCKTETTRPKPIQNQELTFCNVCSVVVQIRLVIHD